MNDDDLILYYYHDGLSDAERAVIEAALENDASLRERYRELCLSLDGFNEASAARAPADAVARWHRSIERAAATPRTDVRLGGRAWHFPSFAWGTLAAALVAAVGFGLFFGDHGAPVTPVAETGNDAIEEPLPVPAARPASFSRGVQVHLRESRQDILRLAEDANADRAILVGDILRQNRLFEEAARDNGAEDIARVLRAFEPVLLRLASEDLSADDAAALRAKLAFELNVMLTKMEQRESHETKSI